MIGMRGRWNKGNRELERHSRVDAIAEIASEGSTTAAARDLLDGTERRGGAGRGKEAAGAIPDRSIAKQRERGRAARATSLSGCD